MSIFPEGDYVSPGLKRIKPDQAFPNMIVGDTNACQWPYLRREIPHNWYVDKRSPSIGFLNRDEVHLVFNNANKFQGKRALEIGCWLGWSACHIVLAGVNLDIIDPLLANPDFRASIVESLRSASKAFGISAKIMLVPGCSPQKVEQLAEKDQCKWSFIFIDGEHNAPGPLNDAIICERYAEEDAMIMFHDLASPHVAQGLNYLRQRGWKAMVYQTMQIMGIAWRGNVEPVQHHPDHRVSWPLPRHLKDFTVSMISEGNQLSLQSANQTKTELAYNPAPPNHASNSANSFTNALSGIRKSTKIDRDKDKQQFQQLLYTIKPYSILSEARLFSLYSLAKQICVYDLPGNFVECGTYKGGSAALLAFVLKNYSQRPRLLYAFDTFEGMPEPTEVDCHQGIPANQTSFGAGTLKAPIHENLEQVCQLLGVTDIVKPVQGLFAHTLPQYKSKIGAIALLHADGDWYQSTMDIFNTLYDSIIQDGVIQVDDYGHWEGCKKAIHKFECLRGVSFALNQIDYTGVWFQKRLR